MDIKRVILPNGKLFTYYKKDDNESWSEYIEKHVLPYWVDYCYSHWIDFETHESVWSFEKRVKNFLDRLAYIITIFDRGDSNVVSRYKEEDYKYRVVPMSECPDYISDMFYSNTTPPMPTDTSGRFEGLLSKMDESNPKPCMVSVIEKKNRKKNTKFQRIERIKKKHPGVKLTWCYVNADNEFEYDGVVHHIENDEVYIPRLVEKDVVASMDQILVADFDGRIKYYDQNAYEIDIGERQGGV